MYWLFYLSHRSRLWFPGAQATGVDRQFPAGAHPHQERRAGRLADASVIACAERNGGKVLTLDFRHFRVVAREKRISLAIDE